MSETERQGGREEEAGGKEWGREKHGKEWEREHRLEVREAGERRRDFSRLTI